MMARWGDGGRRGWWYGDVGCGDSVVVLVASSGSSTTTKPWWWGWRCGGSKMERDEWWCGEGGVSCRGVAAEVVGM
ncbi:hypothetical protein Tco_0308749 [Tanacetum coccineum]